MRFLLIAHLNIATVTNTREPGGYNLHASLLATTVRVTPTEGRNIYIRVAESTQIGTVIVTLTY